MGVSHSGISRTEGRYPQNINKGTALSVLSCKRFDDVIINPLFGDLKILYGGA